VCRIIEKRGRNHRDAARYRFTATLIETVPLEAAPHAVQQMRSGDAKFRIVLTMRETQHAD
jgi:hypothetical protein